MTPHKCLICDAELNEENWYPSDRKRNCHRCKGCTNERSRLWVKANPEKAKDIQTRSERRQGKEDRHIEDSGMLRYDQRCVKWNYFPT